MATLQHSYLENPMDGGAWRAAVHGVTNPVDRGAGGLRPVGSQGVRTRLGA